MPDKQQIIDTETYSIETRPDEHLEFTVVRPDGTRTLIKATGFGWVLDRKPDEDDQGFRKRVDAMAAFVREGRG